MTFCPHCGSLHDSVVPCKAVVETTGPETIGTQITVVVGERIEVFAVLLAEAGLSWRARIATQPRMLWTVPGGRTSMKFYGANSGEAEGLAVGYVREHCKSRGYRVLKEDTEASGRDLGSELTPSSPPLVDRDERLPKALSARFGPDKPTRPARTANLSRGGLFLATHQPLPKGRAIKIALQLGEFNIPLAGTVAWVRTTHTEHEPAGMGVRLRKPPAMYDRYVSKLQEHHGAENSEIGGPES